MKIQDIFLITDLDGTFIGAEHTIPQRNLDAVRRFQEKGGHFAIATGRSVESGQRYYQAADPNGLCVLLNGSVIYDFSTEKTVSVAPLPHTAVELVQRIYRDFPQSGVEVYTADHFYVIRSNTIVEKHLAHEGLTWELTSMDEVIARKDQWCKVLFASQTPEKLRMHDYVDGFEHPGIRFVETSEYFLEMLPDGVDKGSGLDAVIRKTRFERENVYAIGDYYNDVEMLRAAGFAVVPSNAPDDIKALADLVVGHCHDGAVADLIEYIEERAE